MDEENPTPNEMVADVHKALARSPGGTNYSTMARSMSDSRTMARGDDARRLKAPGGFRRHYLNEQAEAAGVPERERPQTWRRSFMQTLRSASVLHHEALLGIRLDAATGAEVSPPRGTAGLPQTALAVLKSFVGSGITFLPGAFAQGGWLFSTPVILTIAMVNAICIWLLLDCRRQTGCPSFGEIAMLAAGPKGKYIVQISIVVSQFGFCIAYFIFVSQLATSMNILSMNAIIFLQLLILIPLCMIRSVESLEYPNLIADCLIFFGVGVVLVSSLSLIWTQRHAVNTSIVPFKSNTCGIFIGMAIFTFEGVPMILPIQSAMKEPDRFWPLFIKLFVGIAMMFAVFGVVGYNAYGSNVETVVLLNLNPETALTHIVKVGYMLALMLTLPLMFLPAARITELWVFGVVEPEAYAWPKNALRTAEVVAFAVVALRCQDHFDRFLSFTGAFCCAPIAFIYPTLFHFSLCAHTRAAQALDLGLILLGFGAVAFALYGSILA